MHISALCHPPRAAHVSNYKCLFFPPSFYAHRVLAIRCYAGYIAATNHLPSLHHYHPPTTTTTTHTDPPPQPPSPSLAVSPHLPRRYGDDDLTQVATRLSSGQRLNQPRPCPSWLYKWMQTAWSARVADRPTFKVFVFLGLGLGLTISFAFPGAAPLHTPSHGISVRTFVMVANSIHRRSICYLVCAVVRCGVM